VSELVREGGLTMRDQAFNYYKTPRYWDSASSSR
jgi:hypothetical protein